MKTIITISFLLVTLFLSGQNSGNIRVSGFVDTYHAMRIKAPNDFLISRSRFRGEIQKISGRSYFFTSVNAVYNDVVPELSAISFREAFLEYTADNWGFKAGRQIIIWGKADGLRITDVISPMDLTEFLAQDYDDIRMPVTALVISRFNTNWAFDFVVVPAFQAYELPGVDNPWGFDYSDLGQNLILDEAQKPEVKWSNIEFGGKLSFYLSGIDFDISALKTWNKSPVYSYYLDESSNFHMKPEYHRMGFVGFGFSKSLSEIILRGESAFYIDKEFSPAIENYDVGLQEKNSINYLVGIDWYPGNELTITGQFSDKYILDYTSTIENQKHTYVSTFGITKKVLRSTLAISSFAYIGLNEGDFFNRTTVDYALSDNIHVLIGADWFHGDSGIFGQYSDNSEIWIKAKYNF